jgi:hypothetical protein
MTLNQQPIKKFFLLMTWRVDVERMGKTKIHTKFLSVNLEGRDRLEDLDVDGH